MKPLNHGCADYRCRTPQDSLARDAHAEWLNGRVRRRCNGCVEEAAIVWVRISHVEVDKGGKAFPNDSQEGPTALKASHPGPQGSFRRPLPAVLFCESTWGCRTAPARFHLRTPATKGGDIHHAWDTQKLHITEMELKHQSTATPGSRR